MCACSVLPDSLGRHAVLPGSSLHGILQGGILECAAMPSSRRSSPSRIEPEFSASPALACGLFTTEQALLLNIPLQKNKTKQTLSLNLIDCSLFHPTGLQNWKEFQRLMCILRFLMAEILPVKGLSGESNAIYSMTDGWLRWYKYLSWLKHATQHIVMLWLEDPWAHTWIH